MVTVKVFVLLGLALVASANPQSQDSGTRYPFHEGCCVNLSFPRPKHVSARTIPARNLLEALKCATSSRLVGGASTVAADMHTGDSLNVAYYFGKYMPEQEGLALTVAVYSSDATRGLLFDVAWERSNYNVTNIAELRKTGTWKVGEINGGQWSYTRLHYLAQEIGSRTTQKASVAAINRSRPHSCLVMFEEQSRPAEGPR